MSAAPILVVTLTTVELRKMIGEAVDSAFSKKHEEASDILTREQAAELVQVHPTVLARYAKTRGLPAIRMGREWRFRRSAILRWLEEQAVQPGAQTERYAAKILAIKGAR